MLVGTNATGDDSTAIRRAEAVWSAGDDPVTRLCNLLRTCHSRPAQVLIPPLLLRVRVARSVRDYEAMRDVPWPLSRLHALN